MEFGAAFSKSMGTSDAAVGIALGEMQPKSRLLRDMMAAVVPTEGRWTFSLLEGPPPKLRASLVLFYF